MFVLASAFVFCLVLAAATLAMRSTRRDRRRLLAAAARIHPWPVAIGVLVFLRAFHVMEAQFGLPNPFVALIVTSVVGLGLRAALREGLSASFRQTISIYAGFLALVLAALFYAEFPESTLGDLRRIFPDGLLLLLMPLVLRTTASVRQLCWTLIVCAAGLGAITAYQHLLGNFGSDFGGLAQVHVMPGATRRAAGPTSPNYFALHLAAITPLAFDRMMAARSRALRGCAGLALVAIVLGVLFTYSRGGFLAMTAALGLSLLRLPPRPRLVTLVAAPLLGLTLLAAAPEDWSARFGRLGEAMPLLRGDPIDDGAVRGRFSEMVSAMLMFTDHPVLGVGYGNFKPRYPDYADQLALDGREDRAGHSLYLETLAEMGIVGAIVLAALVLYAVGGVRHARRLCVAEGRERDASFIAAYQAGLVAFLLGSIFLHLSFAQFFWMFMGTAIALPDAVRGEGEKDVSLGVAP